MALRADIDNWRWAGVPFFLRTGKRLSRKTTEIAVQLKPVPHLAFASDGSVGVQPNLLILDTMRGEATLFARNDEVEAAWRICDPILQAWSKTPGPLPTYPAGSSGPNEADDLLEKGDHWRQL